MQRQQLQNLKLMMSEQGFEATDEAIKEAHYIFEKARNMNNFGNGRYVRKLLEEAEMNLAERLLQMGDIEFTDEMITTIEEEDIPAFTPKKQAEKNRIGFACA